MKKVQLGLSVIASIVLAGSIQAGSFKTDEITLRPNMIVNYNKLPAAVDNFDAAFTEGMVYGRLRTNSFLWDWKYEAAGKRMDNRAMGIGGSIVYKTAPLSGVSATVGVYTSQNPSWFNEKEADIGYVKSGKDTLSRYNVKANSEFDMIVLGQAYLEYQTGKTTFKLGRQMYESAFTKSNDTKMIPNTFDGVTVTNKDLPKTTLKFAYFAKQKLRDHTTSHDVIAFTAGSAPGKWSNNDDAAVNKNLTVARVGDDNELYIASATNKSIKNLKASANVAVVPDILTNVTLEAHYKIPLSSDWKLVPGVRYMMQFDDLNANYDVASLATNHAGYKDSAKQSLDTDLLALRMDLRGKAFLGRLGYSQIADKADILTPWRSFPTGGFTRAMAQYNWNANTKTYMVRADYDFDKANLLKGFSILTRYAIQDTDDKKVGITPDATVIHVDARQALSDNLALKLRLGFIDTKGDIKDKADVSYNEYRLELNYFF